MDLDNEIFAYLAANGYEDTAAMMQGEFASELVTPQNAKLAEVVAKRIKPSSSGWVAPISALTRLRRPLPTSKDIDSSRPKRKKPDLEGTERNTDANLGRTQYRPYGKLDVPKRFIDILGKMGVNVDKPLAKNLHDNREAWRVIKSDKTITCAHNRKYNLTKFGIKTMSCSLQIDDNFKCKKNGTNGTLRQYI